LKESEYLPHRLVSHLVSESCDVTSVARENRKGAANPAYKATQKFLLEELIVCIM